MSFRSLSAKWMLVRSRGEYQCSGWNQFFISFFVRQQISSQKMLSIGTTLGSRWIHWTILGARNARKLFSNRVKHFSRHWAPMSYEFMIILLFHRLLDGSIRYAIRCDHVCAVRACERDGQFITFSKWKHFRFQICQNSNKNPYENVSLSRQNLFLSGWSLQTFGYFFFAPISCILYCFPVCHCHCHTAFGADSIHIQIIPSLTSVNVVWVWVYVANIRRSYLIRQTKHHFLLGAAAIGIECFIATLCFAYNVHQFPRLDTANGRNNK